MSFSNLGGPPPNRRLERTGGEVGCFMRVAVAAGHLTAGR